MINIKLKEYLKEFFFLNKDIVYLEYEKKFSKFLLLEKKRYCGIMSFMDGKKVDRMFYRGIEVIQKSTIEYARKKIEELLKFIMIENRDISFIKKWLEQIHFEIETKQFDLSEITIVNKINRPINSYKTTLPHIRIAKKLINEKKILDVIEEKNSWSQIKYIVTNFKKREEIPISEYNGSFDREYYWEVKIYSSLQRILKIVFPQVNWESLFDKQSKLFDV